jgi:hypothetical protein
VNGSPDPLWRGWVDGIPESLFPLGPEALLAWLRQNRRVPPLYWDQFRTELLTGCAGEQWGTEPAMLAALGRVPWGF